MNVACMINFLAISLSPFLLLLYTIEKTKLKLIKKKSFKIIVSIPILLVELLILINPITQWLFQLDNDVNIVEGKLYIVMLLSASIYLLLVMVIAVVTFIKAKTISMRRSTMTLIVSIAIIIVFVVFDSLLDKVAILPAAVFSVICIIFFNMLDSNVNTDALTGINNRKKAFEYLQEEIKACSEDNPLLIYMCDLNGFKSINDMYGHMEGDDALISVTTALKAIAAKYDAFIARLGGDEFLICLRTGDKEFNPKTLIEELNEKLEKIVEDESKKYKLIMAAGYICCTDKHDNLNNCIATADVMLYENKRKFYQNEKSRS